MGARAIEGVPTAQKLDGYQTLSYSTRSRRTIAIVCCNLRPRKQWSTHPRERRTINDYLAACLLHLKSIIRSKVELHRNKKIAYAVLISSRKLKHYFQAHEITVPSSQLLGDIFNNKEASERIGKWATELS